MFDYYSCISLVLNFLQLAWLGSQSIMDKNTVNVAPLSNQSLQLVHDSHTIEQLRDIFHRVNVIRQVDSESHRAVGQYISNHFQTLSWVIEWDNFTMNTVIGRKTFRNIIVSLGPPELDFLILACHYDSKSIPGFYGSVDSAMPCAIMMMVAESITPLYQSQLHHPYSLRMIFFDGEEAFRDWTDQDSLYGSRHLATVWNQPGSDGSRELSKIKLFVLLDLIGSTGMTIPSYPNGSRHMYDQLVTLVFSSTLNVDETVRATHFCVRVPE
ncbi:glutaminyl-peptide cyclotransferase [Clonorchis sinensis]|uniref:glutaminyl-peptide cyclotransferase n=1 Tax=Clonorchis sinensis TaxID=79923 RepID=G7Y5R1_CLOSI|nr:glutaminyl-peptide cyclotransferase [Clonorchis sinensis]